MTSWRDSDIYKKGEDKWLLAFTKYNATKQAIKNIDDEITRRQTTGSQINNLRS